MQCRLYVRAYNNGGKAPPLSTLDDREESKLIYVTNKIAFLYEFPVFLTLCQKLHHNNINF